MGFRYFQKQIKNYKVVSIIFFISVLSAFFGCSSKEENAKTALTVKPPEYLCQSVQTGGGVDGAPPQYTCYIEEYCANSGIYPNGVQLYSWPGSCLANPKPATSIPPLNNCGFSSGGTPISQPNNPCN
jgi:hypothetical protein